jgi:hypothetical protein
LTVRLIRHVKQGKLRFVIGLFFDLKSTGIICGDNHYDMRRPVIPQFKYIAMPGTRTSILAGAYRTPKQMLEGIVEI